MWFSFRVHLSSSEGVAGNFIDKAALLSFLGEEEFSSELQKATRLTGLLNVMDTRSVHLYRANKGLSYLVSPHSLKQSIPVDLFQNYGYVFMATLGMFAYKHPQYKNKIGFFLEVNYQLIFIYFFKEETRYLPSGHIPRNTMCAC